VERQGAVDAITKAYMIEGDVAADQRQRRARGIEGRLRRRVQDIAEPGDRHPRLMKILPELRQSQHGLGDPARQHVEGDEFAHGQVSLNDEVSAEIKGQRGDDLANELDQLAGPVTERKHVKAGADIAGQLFFPAPLHLRLDRHRLQGLDGADALDQEGLVLGATVELLLQPPPEHRRDAGG
jgi:hypothetical protein